MNQVVHEIKPLALKQLALVQVMTLMADRADAD